MLKSGRSRAFILAASVALLGTASTAQMQSLDAGTVMAAVERLKPGQYIWVPEIAPQGPVLVVVNIATQRLIAYRNGVPIGVSTVSTGKAGHRTPLGVFTILQKAVHHRSSKYSNAPMPYMQRLTWSGIALHGGTLPGYPASHGCIRLPHSFAPLLFGETTKGMTVVVVNQPGALQVAPTPQMARRDFGGPATWAPHLSSDGPVSIIVSAADRRMVVLRNGVQIGSAPVSFDGVVDRMQAYTLRSTSGGVYDWARIGLPGRSTVAERQGQVPAGRLQGSDPFRRALASVVGPGTTMVVIPDSLGLNAADYRGPREQMTLIEDDAAVIDWMQDDRVTYTS